MKKLGDTPPNCAIYNGHTPSKSHREKIMGSTWLGWGWWNRAQVGGGGGGGGLAFGTLVVGRAIDLAPWPV
jgi:hypothetical protein